MSDDVRVRGFIYNGMYEQIKQIQAVDPVMAGELAISYFEQVLTREVSSTNPMIKAMVASMEPIIERDVKEWEKVKKNKVNKKKRDQKLEQIASWKKIGMTNRDIAKRLSVSESTISRRVETIQKDYPELLIQQKSVDEKVDELEKIVHSF